MEALRKVQIYELFKKFHFLQFEEVELYGSSEEEVQIYGPEVVTS